MKTKIATFVALSAMIWPSSAAPRLVVSTPFLVPESEIDLVLDRPVTATADLGKPVENTWLEIKPSIAGKLIWKAQNIASFLPDQPPAIGTTYTFSIPKGKTHIDQSEVPAGQFATLNSEAFGIQSAGVRNLYGENYSASTAEWLLVFNDDVDPVKAGSFINFSSRSGQQVAARLERADRSRVATRYVNSWSSRFKSAVKPDAEIAPQTPVPNALIAVPVSPLPAGVDWKISILKGLPNVSASTAIPSDLTYELGTIEPFRVASFEARSNPDEPRKIVLECNYPLSKELPADFLTKSIRIEPVPKDLKVETDGREIHLLGDFSESDKWTVSVFQHFSSLGGLPLSATASKEVEFSAIDPELVLPSDDLAQLSSGTRSYPVHTVNLASLHVRIKKLSPAELVRAYQGYRNYTGVGHDGESIDPTAALPYSLISGTTILDKEIELGNPIDTSKDITLLWDELLPKDLRTGAIFLDIVGTPNADLNVQGKRNVQAIIQLTDIGLAWKLNKTEAFVYAFSCATGQPLKDVAIDLFAEDSATIQSVKTDASGLATLPRPEAARHLRANLGSDQYITAFDSSLDTVSLWHFPIRYSWNKAAGKTRRAFLFTDRSLYRPGETVRIKGIVRTQAGNNIEAAIASPAHLLILDPAEAEIQNTPVTLSESGAFDVSFTLPEGKTGTHTIRLEYPEDIAKAEAIEDDWEAAEALKSSSTFSIDLRVEEFRRNAFEVEQTLAKPANGATQISSELSAKYYQGQPVAAGKVKHYTRIVARNPYPERFRDFLFGNHRTDDWGYWYHYFGYRFSNDGDEEGGPDGPASSQGETVLNPEGKTTLAIEIPKADFPTAREVTISSEVTDTNNQTLTSSATTTVNPAAVYIGISRIDKLVRAGDAVSYKIVAVDPDGNPYPNPVNVTATLTRDVNSAVRSRNEDGETVTRNDVREENVLVSKIDIDPAKSAGQGQEFTVAPKNNGRHFLTIRGIDADGRDFATVTSFYAYGTDEYPWLYEDGLRVKMVAEKKSYKPGETARVLVLSPIEGTALVTVEREKVLRSFLTKLTADKPVIEIPIGEDDAPNAYVSILIVKGAAESAREHKEPQLRLGYCELTIESAREKLAVTLDAAGPANETFTVSTAGQAPKTIPACRPGDEVTLTGTVTLADGRPAAGTELTIYAEDEGTLAVMGYVTPDPLAFFYNPRDLGLDAGVSFNNFLSEDPENQNFYNKGFFVGGGGDLGKLADLYRKNFDPCATWAPVVKAGADGKFSHTFKVPDTLTRYRLVAVAHQGVSKFGATQSDLIVNKPLMLEPKAPRFANQGDTFSPQVLVQNASPEAGTWEVVFSTGNGKETPTCKVIGESTQTITLNAGASGTLVFPVTAESTGEAVFSWKATPVSLASGKLTPALGRSLSDAVETRFQINYPMPLLREVKFVKIDKAQNLLDQITPNLLSGSGSIDLEFARSPLSEISGSVDFLLSYPHGCVEQTTSSLMPWFAVKPLKSVVPAFAKMPEEKVKAAIQKGADRLLSMQLPDGSFTYWPGSTTTVEWASSYAGLGLIMARENGANIPDSAIEGLTKHLIESLRGTADTKSTTALEQNARSLWVLAIAGQPQAAYQSVLIDRLPDLTPAARAFLALAIHATDENSTTPKTILNSKTPLRLKSDSWMRWDADDSLKLLAWATIDPGSKETTAFLDRLLHDRNPYGHWQTTWVNGWSLLAMSTYAEGEKISTSEWSAQLPTGPVKLDEKNPTAAVSMKITPGLKLDVDPKGSAYVRIRVAAQPKIEPLQPVATNGLSVDRFYERIKADGTAEVLTEPKVGDLIRVSLRVTLPADNTRYLVVEDLLPSVFETVNTDFKSQRSATGVVTSEKDWEVSHSELRTDRAVFYLDEVWRKGTYTLTYLARCTVSGEADAPPAKVESMYDPTFFALSASRIFSTK